MGQKPEAVTEQFKKMKYTDKQLNGFQTYFKKISEQVKDRILFDNTDMMKKVSKLPETHDAKQYYYEAQVAPIEELLHQRTNVILPSIKELEALLEMRKLQLQMLNVYISVHHPESNSIKFLMSAILVSIYIILYVCYNIIIIVCIG